MDVFSELKQAQLEVNSSGLSIDANKVGQIGYKSTTAPMEINDGTQVHKVLTDKMYNTIRNATNPNYANSLSSGTFTTTSNTLVDVTNMVASISAVGGKPVEITLHGGFIHTTNLVGATAGTVFQLLRDGVAIGDEVSFYCTTGGGAPETASVTIPCGGLRFIDFPPSEATYEYKLQVRSLTTSIESGVSNCFFMVREL